MSDYRQYVNDKDWAARYSAYQQKYRTAPRESDKVLIRWVEEVASPRAAILDAGCSTGNLLYHLHQHVPAQLLGVDLMQDAVDQCREDPALEGIHFERGDITDLYVRAFTEIPLDDDRFDIILANAVLALLDESTAEGAIRHIHEALKPSGHLFLFDYVNSFNQELVIQETSPMNPDGVTLYWRSERRWCELLSAFSSVTFHPFRIPIDLAATPGSLETRTVLVDGDRLLFRGSLCQPWCHVRAQL